MFIGSTLFVGKDNASDKTMDSFAAVKGKLFYMGREIFNKFNFTSCFKLDCSYLHMCR